MTATTKEQWIKMVHQLGPDFESRAALHDREDTFVAQNYTELKQRRFLAAAIPLELGGGGLSHSGMCGVLRTLAQYCGSTALALSMHQHLLAANIWKYRRGQGFYRGFGLERLFRDVQAAKYHPLPEKEQQQFLGKCLLKNEAFFKRVVLN